MNESGATAWEVRELARRIDREGAFGLVEVDLTALKEGGEGVFDDLEAADVETCLVPDRLRDAILVEALNCLADKKEAERRVA